MQNLSNYIIIATIPVVAALATLPGFTTESPEEYARGTIDIGVVVSDLQRSLDFYTNVLGMSQTGEINLTTEFGESSGLTGGVPLDIKILKLKDEPQATAYKLMSFNSKAGHSRPRRIQDDTGVQYITLMVSSLDPFLKRIKSHDVKLLGKTPIPLGDDRRFALIQDPDGTFIELIGP